MASQDKLKQAMAAIEQDDEELMNVNEEDASIDFNEEIIDFGGRREPLSERLKPAELKETDTAAMIEAARREAAEAAKQEASERYDAMMADALARQRAEFEAERASNHEKIEAEREQLKAYREKERENATKLDAKEREEYVEIYGEDRAESFIKREEANRKRLYDMENKLLAKEQAELVQKPKPDALPSGFAGGVDDINNGFSGFNEIAKTVGGVSWSDFTRTEKFKKAAQDEEFKALWSSAFHIKDGVISGVNSTFANLAKKKLTELMAGSTPSGFVPQPKQSREPKLTTGSGDGEGKVFDHATMRQAFKSGNKKILDSIAKQIH